MNKTCLKKLIVIVGPTASGKSGLAVELARIYGGEIISADSRQVYRGMDIGSGKVTKKETRGIKHHLLDVASPKRTFSAAQYQKLALKAVKQIQKKGKIPILCGGTGFYIKAVTEQTNLPTVAPDWKLRNELAKKSTDELFAMLTKKDPRTAKRIERSNPRRLIRALEIVMKTGKPVPETLPLLLPYPILTLGISVQRQKLKRLISQRLAKRLDRGMLSEVKKLRFNGVSWKKLESFGLEYRFCAFFLQKKITYSEMVDKIQIESEHYVKRQLTWFKKDKTVHWIKNLRDTKKLVGQYLAMREKITARIPET
jgi:tRNA dimethylallyltransferase